MKKRTESIMGMAFFGPALVLLTIFLFLPMILTLIFSFTDFFALNPGLTHFVGLDNYIQIFKDDVFSQAFFNTVKFVIIIVPLQGIGALVLALLINKVTHCKKYFKVAFFVPVVMSLAVVSTLWIQISRSFFADSSYMLSFSVLCSCVCSRLISPSVSSWHKQDNTLMHQSPGHIQRRTPYNF